MRLTTDFWTAALLRRVFASGGFGAVLRRGGDSAGAVFIVMRNRLGEVRLYAPAPQTDYDEGKPDERRFVALAGVDDDATLAARMQREQRFDPDVWFIEIETAADTPGDLFPVTTP